MAFRAWAALLPRAEEAVLLLCQEMRELASLAPLEDALTLTARSACQRFCRWAQFRPTLVSSRTLSRFLSLCRVVCCSALGLRHSTPANYLQAILDRRL